MLDLIAEETGTLVQYQDDHLCFFDGEQTYGQADTEEELLEWACEHWEDLL